MTQRRKWLVRAGRTANWQPWYSPNSAAFKVPGFTAEGGAQLVVFTYYAQSGESRGVCERVGSGGGLKASLDYTM